MYVEVLMKNKIKHVLAFCSFLLLLSALFLTQSAYAKGTFTRVTISGPGLGHDIEISDPELLNNITSLCACSKKLSDPPKLTHTEITETGYVITRGQDVNDEFLAWDMLLYVPSQTDDGGYVYYLGIVYGDSWSEYDGYWFEASLSGDAAMRHIIRTNRIPSETEQTIAPLFQSLFEAFDLLRNLFTQI